ncbi:MAG: tripartite tricarboxylate transporter permease [Pseudomonadota bacterium]
MLAEIPAAFGLLLTWQGLLTLIAGTALGIVLGAMPGIGSTVAVALVLPFTLTMDQAPAIILLLAVYAGSVYGGSISAILINTPGTPAAAATVLDGTPMARAGKAGEALGWATLASVFGGLCSAVVLLAAAPQLAAFALRFGPIETFALICLGMTCIVTVSKGSVVKGLVAGALGLFLSSVGGDPITGEVRFTFGQYHLIAGFNLLAVVIGIFAFSEILIRIADGASDGGTKVDFKGLVLPRLAAWKTRIRGLLKSTAIGSGVGILPGTGSATAAFIAYAEAKRSSPRGAEFGRGEPDGIVAAESANNAVTGGALVPTLALGIPGDVITAVMLATFTLHGITPGVRLMEDNPTLIAAIFLGFFLINLLLLPLGLVLSKVAAPLLRIREPLMLGAIGVLCVLGVFYVRGNPFDLLVMFGAGVAGLFLRRAGYPMAPLIIGMVLGPALELSLRQGLILTDGSIAAFVTGSPIAATLLAVTVVVLVWPVATALKRRS